MTEYELRAATSEQYYVSLKRQVVLWSGGMSWEQFKDREERLGRTAFGQHVRCWALVDKSDPDSLSFPCSCETYRRPAFVKQAADGQVRKVVSYSIASVFADPEQRGKGHAQMMMTLLHDQLRAEGAQLVDWTDQDEGQSWRNGRDGVASWLYSDVGNYYARCGQAGWTIVSPVQTTWSVDSVSGSAAQATSLRPITADDFESVAQDDERQLREEVANSARSVAFAAVPQGINYAWRAERSLCYAEAFDKTRPTRFGARSSDGKSFVMWHIDYQKNNVGILRLRATPDTAHSLIRAALDCAKECGLPTVIAWNVPKDVLDALPEEERGETKERGDSLSAIAWYGESPVHVADIDWPANEYYAWC